MSDKTDNRFYKEAGNTLALWNAVEKTDPKYTKAFSRAGGFSGTAINATYLIRKATELWGPVGGAWGFDIADEKYVPGSDATVIHVVRIQFRHPAGAFPTFGQTTFVGKNKNGPFTDEEAPKKSLTDAITKALSMLGFAADVHLGLYDDNKYVNDRKAEFGGKSVAKETLESQDQETQKWLADMADSIRAELTDKGAEAALKLLDEQGLSADHKVALWAFFDSKERSALKGARKSA